MGEFKPLAQGDGSWAHPPEQDVPTGQLPPGPFQVTDMPAPQPVPPPKSVKTRKMLRTVAPADDDS